MGIKNSSIHKRKKIKSWTTKKKNRVLAQEKKKKTIHSTQSKKNGYICLVWFYNIAIKKNTVTHLLKIQLIYKT